MWPCSGELLEVLSRDDAVLSLADHPDADDRTVLGFSPCADGGPGRYPQYACTCFAHPKDEYVQRIEPPPTDADATTVAAIELYSPTAQAPRAPVSRISELRHSNSVLEARVIALEHAAELLRESNAELAADIEEMEGSCMPCCSPRRRHRPPTEMPLAAVVPAPPDA